MGGVSIMSDSLSGAQSAFTARQTLYYQKNKNFRFSQVSFIKSIDLKISIFEKVLPTNLSILEFNLLSFISLSFGCTATGSLKAALRIDPLSVKNLICVMLFIIVDIDFL